MDAPSPVPKRSPDDPARFDDLVIRPATSGDIEDFHELACLAGAGFTSLPADEALLAERLLLSERAFLGEEGVLMLGLEDQRTKRVVGCAAIKPGGSPRADFLNFLIDDDWGALRTTDRYAEMTEVGSLLLHPDYRRGGIGPWLARSRYLLIAGDLERFGTHIFSELRGMVDEDDRSPFYDAVCAPYFGMSFAEADDLCARGRQAEINQRLPAEPIALDDLPDDARAAMCRPHRAGQRALDYLEEEGFRFEGVVDLLDGGPAVVTPSRSIRTISESFEARLRPGAVEDECAREAYMAIGSGPDFRCCRSWVSIENGDVYCPSDTLPPLEFEEASTVNIHFVGSSKARESHPRAAIGQELSVFG